MTSCQKIVMSLSFYQFMVNLEQSGCQIPDASSVNLIFSLIVICYLTKTENRTKKKTNTAHTLLLWVKVLFLPKNADFLQKNAAISKSKRALVLKDSETAYGCVRKCLKSQPKLELRRPLGNDGQLDYLGTNDKIC